MTDHYCEFPFNELRTPTGDYFSSRLEMEIAGFQDSQMWSVVESDGQYSFGPPHHIVNLLGYVATAEHHDGDTYYHEPKEDYS